MFSFVTKGKVLEALNHVQDPEIHKSIVELNMVRNIKVKRKSVSLEVVLTISGCPLKAKIEKDVKDALYAMGFQEVQLTFGSMTKEEREELTKQLTRHAAGPNVQSSPHSSEGQPQVIAVMSGKGGVGKSTVTVNLAVSLAGQGFKVGLIDADIYGYSVPKMMGITQKPTMFERLTLPVEKEGVKVMSIGFFVDDNGPVIWRGPMLGKTLRHFMEGVYWGELDYLIIDLPPGTGDVALDIQQLFPNAKQLMVTTPQETAAYVAERAGTMLKQANQHVLGVVENMSYHECGCGERSYIFGKGGGERLAATLQTELLVQLPLYVGKQEEDLISSAPSVFSAETKQGQMFMQLARTITEKAPVHQPARMAK